MEVSPKQVEAEKNWERREAEGMEKLTTAQREIAEKKIEEAATKVIAIISYPAKEDGDVELRTDTATAAYAGLKRAHATNAGVWLIKHSTITKFHDMCRDKGITVNEEVGNAERP